ncbi:hypothetical protein PGH44_03570 [Legionella pneumophila]|nr:hypothetical protein PGH44_03570 [Legionella pneumophila]
MKSLRMAGVLFLFLFSFVSIHVYAAPNTGASNAEMKDVCQLAGELLPQQSKAIGLAVGITGDAMDVSREFVR